MTAWALIPALRFQKVEVFSAPTRQARHRKSGSSAAFRSVFAQVDGHSRHKVTNFCPSFAWSASSDFLCVCHTFAGHVHLVVLATTHVCTSPCQIPARPNRSLLCSKQHNLLVENISTELYLWTRPAKIRA